MGYHFSSRLTATLNLCLIYFKITSKLAILLEHVHKKFRINRTKIKGGCQSGRKVVTHNSRSDLPLLRFVRLANLRKILHQCVWLFESAADQFCAHLVFDRHHSLSDQLLFYFPAKDISGRLVKWAWGYGDWPWPWWFHTSTIQIRSRHGRRIYRSSSSNSYSIISCSYTQTTNRKCQANSW